MTQRRYFWHDRKLLSHFWVNVAVGILIALAFECAGESQWGEGMRDAAFDLLVKYEFLKAPDSAQRSNPLYFVEITPAEYRQWGEPLLTPRNKVADLIEAAWKKGAPVVVLDILLDRPDREHPDADLKLRRLLGRMLRENARTRVVFPVRIGVDGKLRSHLCEDLFERKTADGVRLFYPALPTVLASDVDLLNRFWDCYQVCRDRSGQNRIIWSVPVLATALHTGSQDQLDRAARKLLAAAGQEGRGSAEELEVELGAGAVHLAPLERVASAPGTPPAYQAGESDHLSYAQRIRFLISSQTPARRDSGNFRPGLSPDLLTGKIVIIGNASYETGDILATPVGQMPGMYLLGNAINTIATDRMPAHLNHWLEFAMEALVIVIAAWFFLRFHTMLAQLLTSIIFLAVLIPLSWGLYRNFGLFFNFIAPVVGMRLHGCADSLESMIAAKGRKHHDHNHDHGRDLSDPNGAQADGTQAPLGGAGATPLATGTKIGGA